MIDFIKIVATVYEDIPYLPEPFNWHDLYFTPKYRKGHLYGFESEYKGFRVLLINGKIELANSIHKFYKGNNYSNFSRSELVDAINIVCNKFKIEPQHWEIKKLEFGFVIETPKPATNYIDLFFSYKVRHFDKMIYKHKHYGRKCFMSEYALKVYDKYAQTKMMSNEVIQNNKLRVEFCYNQKRKLPKQIKTLSDLLDEEKIKVLYTDLISAFEKVLYNDEAIFSDATFEEITLFHASFQSNYVQDIEKSTDKKQAKKIKERIKLVRERFLKKEFKYWFLKSLKNKYIELYCT